MRVVIFGAGKKFNHFLESPLSSYIKIIAVLDNDEKKWGTKIEGCLIGSPQILKGLNFDKIVITAYYDEIKEQLIVQYNVDEAKIIKLEWLIVPSLFNTGDIGFKCDYDCCYSISDLVKGEIITHNRLEDFFFYGNHNPITKWWHYFEIYHQYFNKFVGTQVKILEIGVYKGGSLQMWRDYFGNKAVIIGIDINENCKQYEDNQIHICIGSQNDTAFLERVSEQYGPFDIVLDDGSHFMEHQITAFETLFPLLKSGGVYLCEDTHTSYWSLFYGALQSKDTFIEYSKKLVDEINGQHVRKEYKDFRSKFWGILKGLHFYDSMVVAEKNRTGYVIESVEGK